jgi:hypothetical protein
LKDFYRGWRGEKDFSKTFFFYAFDSGQINNSLPLVQHTIPQAFGLLVLWTFLLLTIIGFSAAPLDITWEFSTLLYMYQTVWTTHGQHTHNIKMNGRCWYSCAASTQKSQTNTDSS